MSPSPDFESGASTSSAIPAIFGYYMQFFVSTLGMKALPGNSHYGSIAVIPAWMPESSAMDGDMLVA